MHAPPPRLSYNRLIYSIILPLSMVVLMRRAFQANARPFLSSAEREHRCDHIETVTYDESLTKTSLHSARPEFALNTRSRPGLRRTVPGMLNCAPFNRATVAANASDSFATPRYAFYRSRERSAPAHAPENRKTPDDCRHPYSKRCASRSAPPDFALSSPGAFPKLAIKVDRSAEIPADQRQVIDCARIAPPMDSPPPWLERPPFYRSARIGLLFPYQGRRLGLDKRNRAMYMGTHSAAG
jgi:hypothetical protein